MNEKDFYSIKKKLGYCGSWAIWSEVKDTPKSNMGDLSLLDPSINKNLLNEVNPNITAQNICVWSIAHSYNCN